MQHKHTRASTRKESTTGDTAPPPSSPREKLGRADEPAQHPAETSTLRDVEYALRQAWRCLYRARYDLDGRERDEALRRAREWLDRVNANEGPYSMFSIQRSENEPRTWHRRFHRAGDLTRLLENDLDALKAELRAKGSTLGRGLLSEAESNLEKAHVDVCWGKTDGLGVDRAGKALARAQEVLARLARLSYDDGPRSSEETWNRYIRARDLATYLRIEILRLEEAEEPSDE